MAEVRKPFVVGIAGGSGSGKTTIARSLAASLSTRQVALIEQDCYYRDQRHLSAEERAKVNYDHPDAIELELLGQHIDDLSAGRGIDKPRYDFERHLRRDESERVEPRPVVLLEGILLFAEPELRDLLDFKIYVDTAADIRLIRRLKRDLRERGREFDDVLRQYLDTVRPMHLEFVEPSKRYADVIIPVGGRNKVAIDMVVTKLREVLGAGGPA